MGLLAVSGRIDLNASPFHASLKGVRAAVAGLGGAFSGLRNQIAGVLSVGFLVNETHKLIEYGSQIHDIAQKTGISTDAIQEFGYAAKQSGSDIDAVARALKNLAKARLEALQNPSGEHAQAFKAVGVNPQDTNLERSFMKLGEAVRNTNFGAGTEPLIEKLLGKNGVELIPMMIDGLEKLREEAQKFNLGNDIIDQLDEAGDAVDRLQFLVRGPLASAFSYVMDLVLKIQRVLASVLAAVATVVEKVTDKSPTQWLKDVAKLTSPVAWFTPGLGGKRQRDEIKEIAKAAAEAFNNEMADTAKEQEQFVKAKQDARKRERDRIDNRPVKEFAFDQKALSPLSDSLLQIGNFLGTDPNRQTIDRLTKIENVLREIRDNTKKSPNTIEFPQ